MSVFVFCCLLFAGMSFVVVCVWVVWRSLSASVCYCVLMRLVLRVVLVRRVLFVVCCVVSYVVHRCCLLLCGVCVCVVRCS